MRRLALALLAIFLTAGGLTAVQPRASASGDSSPVHISVPARR
ncbi:hypothetical protein [Nocardioides potassii]|nr:hypothetical protein [Nocardioides potassii]